jgi:hypothetical protein
MNRVREYIAANPARWAEGTNNPNCSLKGTQHAEFEDLFVRSKARLAPTPGTQ